MRHVSWWHACAWLVATGCATHRAPNATASHETLTQPTDRRPASLESFEQSRRTDAFDQAKREKRHEAMALLQAMLRNQDATGLRRAEMLHRLAELYSEEARDQRLAEMAAYQQAWDCCAETGSCDPDTLPRPWLATD